MVKNFAKGFTLSEAIVVMGILGIVAAMSIPQIVNNTQTARNGALLSRAVQQVENGCKNVIAVANSSDDSNSMFEGYSSIRESDMPGGTSSETSLTGLQLLGNPATHAMFELSDTLNADANASTSGRLRGYTPRIYSGDTRIGNWSLNGGLYASMTIGSFISIGPIGIATNDMNAAPVAANVNSDDPIVDIIMIDANAEGKPNRLGKDIFVFGLTDRCNMIPAGAPKMRTIGYPSSSDDVCTDNNQGTGMACAERVVRDKYKINY